MNKPLFLTLSSCLFLLPSFSTAQSVPQILQDIHAPKPDTFEAIWNLYPDQAGNLFFEGYCEIFSSHGLWKHDGSSENAQLIEAYENGFYTGNMNAPADTGLYIAINTTSSPNVWRIYYTDGSANGLRLVDVAEAPNFEMTVLKGTLFYRKKQPDTGVELWATGKTPGSNHLIKDCRPGPASGSPSRFKPSDDKGLLYFQSTGTDNKTHIWRTDGTSDGTFVLISENASLRYVNTVGDKNYIQIAKANQDQLWLSEGTANTTVKIKDLYTNSLINIPYGHAGGKHMFVQYHPDSGYEWWVSDGTADGTNLLIDINLEETSSLGYEGVFHLQDSDELLFFRKNPNVGIEIWTSDGTMQGTAAHIWIPNQVGVQSYQAIGAWNNRVYLILNRGAAGIELFATNGKDDNTQQVATLLDFEVDVFYLLGQTTAKGVYAQIVSQSADLVGFKYQLFKSDGKEAGTQALMGKPSSVFTQSRPDGFIKSASGSLLFRASNDYDKSYIYEYKNDQLSAVQENKIYYNAPKSNSDKSCWFKNDSTLACLTHSGTFMEIPLPLSAFYHDLTAFNNQFYLLEGSAKILEIGASNQVKTIASTAFPSRFLSMITTADSLFWLRETVLTDSLFLSRFDGNMNNIHISERPVHLTSSSTPKLVLRNGRYAIIGTHITEGVSRIITQGFPDIDLEQYSNYELAGLEIMADTIYLMEPPVYDSMGVSFSLFRAHNLEKTKIATFEKVAGYDLNTSYFGDAPDFLHSIPHQLLFGAGPKADVELWKSDGTAAGTNMLKDINTMGSSNPINFVRFSEHQWLFTAYNGQEYGWWATNGSLEGSFQIAALPQNGPYAVDPNPTQAYLMDHGLFFSMNDGLHGQEPWMLELGDSLVSGIKTLPIPFQALDISPNPASDMLQIRLPALSDQTEVKYEIWNTQGILQLQGKASALDRLLRIALPTTLCQGVYLLILPERKQLGKFVKMSN